MLRLLSLWFLCLVAGLVSGCAAADSLRSEATRSMTVCQLYTARRAPPTGEIRVKATAYMGPRHGAILVDAGCPPGATIPFRFADDLPRKSVAAMFDRALTGDVMNLSLRAFNVQAIGRFSASSESNPRGLFYIEKVDWFKPRDPQHSH